MARAEPRSWKLRGDSEASQWTTNGARLPKSARFTGRSQDRENLRSGFAYRLVRAPLDGHRTRRNFKRQKRALFGRGLR